MLLDRAVVLAVLVGSFGCGAHARVTMGGSGGEGAGVSGTGAGGSGAAAAASGAGGTNHGIGPDAGPGATGNAGHSASANDACGPVLHKPRCLVGGWCWDGPSFVGGDLLAIDGTRDAKSVWAVGLLGTAFRYCGGSWLPIDTGVEDHLLDVFSLTQDFALAVGEHGTAIVWDGATWKRIAMPTDRTLRAVWGASATDVWIGSQLFGDATLDNLFHFDGSKITDSAATGTSIRAIRGRSASDIYAVGDQDWWARADHYDGKTWNQGMINSDPDPGSAQQLIFGPTKNRTFAQYNGSSTAQVFADDQPGWRSVFEPQGRVAGLYLDDANTPSVVVTSPTADPLMPGVVWKPTDDVWMMTSDRFTAWPEEVWTGAGHDWAAGHGNALLARGDDGVWSQVPEIDAMLGNPSFLGGSAEDNAYLVSENDIYHRDAGGWKSIKRVAEGIESASSDRHGDLYISVYGGAVRRYDGSTWYDVPAGMASGGTVHAFAPDDIWYAESTFGAHFDGSSWTGVYKLCNTSDGRGITRYRQAPDGTIWGIDESGAVQFALPSPSCTVLSRNDTQDGDPVNDPLLDVAWTENGEMWAISHWGRLFRRNGANFELQAMPGVDAIPDAGVSTTGLPQASELFAVPGNKLRYLLSDGDLYASSTRDAARGRLVTVDVTSPTLESTIDDVPVAGPLWALDATHTFVAFPGGVLRRDAQ